MNRPVFQEASFLSQSTGRVLCRLTRKLDLQFPDPHFKTKHKKRRVIQPQVVADLAKLMPPGGMCSTPFSLHIVAHSLPLRYDGIRAVKDHNSESSQS